MARVSPLRKEHQHAEAAFLAYGAPEADRPAVDVVETFGELESEYAALRKGCILLDQPQRGTVAVRGADRMAFLNSMLTQELKGLGEFRAVRSFWLNRKGRIDADARVLILPGEVLLDLDIHSAARVVETLGAFVIAEDVCLTDETEQRHRIALHGPTAPALLQATASDKAGSPIADLSPGHAGVVEIAGREVVVDRQDSTGEPGLELLLRPDDVGAVWRTLLERGSEPNGRGFRLRAAGWHAYNIARIEAGWPLYNIDFGPNSLPHETGVLRDRVSFRKGCFLGQEVVARMESLGQPKQVLCAMRLDSVPSADPRAVYAQPVAGAHVFEGAGPDAEIIGAVTSSALAPMLAGSPAAFAQVRTRRIRPGAEVYVEAEGRRVRAVLAAESEGLCLWTRPPNV